MIQLKNNIIDFRTTEALVLLLSTDRTLNTFLHSLNKPITLTIDKNYINKFSVILEYYYKDILVIFVESLDTVYIYCNYKPLNFLENYHYNKYLELVNMSKEFFKSKGVEYYKLYTNKRQFNDLALLLSFLEIIICEKLNLQVQNTKTIFKIQKIYFKKVFHNEINLLEFYHKYSHSFISVSEVNDDIFKHVLEVNIFGDLSAIVQNMISEYNSENIYEKWEATSMQYEIKNLNIEELGYEQLEKKDSK